MARSSARIELGRKALHIGIGQGEQAVGNELRRAEQVAQIVVDFRHREAERRKPALLLEHRGEFGLHGRQLALGDADLVGSPPTAR